LEAVEATVQRYLRDEAAHAEGARRASLTQNVNRAADAYNRLAKGAAEALVKYQAELAIMEAYG
jgi:hypothetical protein